MSLCTISRSLVSRYDFPDDTLLFNESKALEAGKSLNLDYVAIVYHGVFSMAAWHFAAYVGNNELIEFSPHKGISVEPLFGTDSFAERAIRCKHQCSDSSDRIMTVLKLSEDATGIPANRKLPFFVYPRERARWAKQHLKKHDYDLLDFNCEHVTRWILTGNAVSVQTAILRRQRHSVANSLLISCISTVTKASARPLLVASVIMLGLLAGRPFSSR